MIENELKEIRVLLNEIKTQLGGINLHAANMASAQVSLEKIALELQAKSASDNNWNEALLQSAKGIIEAIQAMRGQIVWRKVE